MPCDRGNPCEKPAPAANPPTVVEEVVRAKCGVPWLLILVAAAVAVVAGYAIGRGDKRK